MQVHVHFSDYYEVKPDDLEAYGAFNISLITDLPLFIDPFLLFNSKKGAYRQLHDEMIRYLRFLCEKSKRAKVTVGLLQGWYRFPEVRQNWLGFTKSGNQGRGLGKQFAIALNENFDSLFSDFGQEKITQGSHLEKLCLIGSGVGRDMISDFTANLILGFLCKYTETFAKKHIRQEFLRTFAVRRTRFNYLTESWEVGQFTLPTLNGDFVLLTPRGILTKDETWINKTDFFAEFDDIPDAIPNRELRDQINNYFISCLPKLPPRKLPTKKEINRAIQRTALRFPEVFDYYIRHKELNGDKAVSKGHENVAEVHSVFVEQAKSLILALAKQTTFYEVPLGTMEDAKSRVMFLKDVVENKGGWRLFYYKGKPIRKEDDLQILYRLTWFSTPHDVSREVNDGRGPVDFKVSHGAWDKTLVEMKLASNPKLKHNLACQLEVYQKASDANDGMKVILFFSGSEEKRVRRILKELKIDKLDTIVLIDARSDNKPSGSNVQRPIFRIRRESI